MDNYNNNYNNHPNPNYNQPNPNYNQPNLNYSPPKYSAQAYLRQTPQPTGQKTLGIISLVCGIAGLLCCLCCVVYGLPIEIILHVAAIVCGFLSIHKQEDKDAKAMAIAGIICGGIGLFLMIICLVIGAASFIPYLSNYEDIIEKYT